MIKENQKLLARLRDAGINMYGEKKVSRDTLGGKTFVLTGTLPTLTRNEAKEKIEQAGGKAEVM